MSDLIEIEVQVLDAVHDYLAAHKRGTARKFADHSGIAVGRVNQVLAKSELVIRREKKGSQYWIADWRMLGDCRSKFGPLRGRHLAGRRGSPAKSEPAGFTKDKLLAERQRLTNDLAAIDVLLQRFK